MIRDEINRLTDLELAQRGFKIYGHIKDVYASDVRGVKRIGIIVLLAILAACGVPPTEGIAVHKSYEPETMHFQYVDVGNTMNLIPIFKDERWLLTLSDGEQTWRVEVTEEEYNTIEIGNIYSPVIEGEVGKVLEPNDDASH